MTKTILSIFLGLMLIGTAQADPLDSASYHLKAADRYAASKQYDKALGEYNAAITRDKKQFGAWLGKAKSELVLGKLKDMKASLEEVDDLASSKAQKFEFLLTEGQYYLAAKPKHWLRYLKQDFFKARDINRNRGDLQLLIARAYRADGKKDLARKHYSKAIELGGPEAAIANDELASIFRQELAAGTGKGWVGTLAGKPSVNRATLAAVLVDDIEIQNLFPKRSHEVPLPKDCKGNPFSAAIDTVLNTDITSITTDAQGLFNPDAPVTRFELAKLIQEILIAYTKKDELRREFVGTKSPFPDLSPNHYAYNAAFLAVSRGLMTPVDLVSGDFGGNKAVSGEDLLLVLRKLGALNRHHSS